MYSQSISLTKPAGFAPSSRAAHHAGRRGWIPFLGHFAQMVVAMVLGMMVGGMLGTSDVSGAELQALLMAASMTVPMVAWMRVRRHSWRTSAEMAAAMVVPAAALFPLLWSSYISGDTLIGLQHGLMLPSMLAAMLYRRSEYGL